MLKIISLLSKAGALKELGRLTGGSVGGFVLVLMVADYDIRSVAASTEGKMKSYVDIKHKTIEKDIAVLKSGQEEIKHSQKTIINQIFKIYEKMAK